jgi:hypothetical protein
MAFTDPGVVSIDLHEAGFSVSGFFAKYAELNGTPVTPPTVTDEGNGDYTLPRDLTRDISFRTTPQTLTTGPFAGETIVVSGIIRRFNLTAQEKDEFSAELIAGGLATEANVDANETKIDALDTKVDRVLGLMYENSVMEPLTFQDDGNGNQIMVTGEIRIYDSKANADTDDGSTGLVAKYAITQSHIGDKLTKFTQTLEP